MSKVIKKRSGKWEQSSERALIEIWTDKLGELRGCRKNSHILLEMMAELQGHGFTYTVLELKTKMHNMTARYRKEKQKIGSTGGSPSDWDLFKEMDALMAPYKSYNCEGLVVDCINHINSTSLSKTMSPSNSTVPNPPSPSNSTVSQSPSPLPSAAGTSSKPGTKKIFLNKCDISVKVDNMQKDIRGTSEKLLSIETEKKDILKAYVEREAEVQKALIEFLKRP